MFGFSRKKRASISTTTASMSPEALALLQQMADERQQQIAAESVPSVPGMTSTPAGPLPDMPIPSMPIPSQPVKRDAIDSVGETEDTFNDKTSDSDGNNASETGFWGRRAIGKADRKQRAKIKKEEKIRAARRRRLAKSGFSRTRYLREANGNAMTSLVLLIGLFFLLVPGPIIINTQYVLPLTAKNRVIIAEIAALQANISQSQPIIEMAIADKNARETEISRLVSGLKDTPTARSALLGFIAALEQNGVRVKSQASRNIVSEEIGIANLIDQRATISLEASFLDYLLIRNKFIRGLSSINVSQEVITARGTNPLVGIELSLSLPTAPNT